MNKLDYSSNFKTKISRSLTDLQNSLDEACRLGLPPHFETTMNNRYDENHRNYNFKSDTTHNLERMITNNEQNVQHTQFAEPTSSQLVSRSNDRLSNNSVLVVNHREAYLNVLRSIANDRLSNKMERSHSHDVLGSLCPHSSGNIGPVSSINDEMAREIRILRQRLVDMDEEITRLRSIASPRNELNVGELSDELNKKVDAYRAREEALLNQLNEAVMTIEEAKFEEMQAVMQAEQLKEELDNMDKRFNEFVNENARQMGNQSEMIEKEVQASVRHIKDELDGVRIEMNERLGECQGLREQLKTANNEIDRLNLNLRSMQNDRCNNEHSLEASLARAVMHRDEAMAHNQRLQGALDRERSERGSEVTMLKEEICDLRKRLTIAENNEMNTTQDRVNLLKESEELKVNMAKMKQVSMSERRRDCEEKEKREREWEERVRVLGEEMSRKEIHFEEVIGEATMVMRTQGVLIERLRAELAATVEEMDGWAEKYHEERDELRWRVSRATESLVDEQGRVKELQEMVDEQGRVMATMRERNGELESSKQSQDGEIITLMSSRNALLKTVELMQAHLAEFRRRVRDCACGVFDAGERLVSERVLEHVVAAM